jgi:hypothetical protein
MEVHHHPDLHHKAKPWKEYLLEGLMIFIAVTLGFFAESLRESISENKKEKQLVVALEKDLRQDTANLNVLITSYLPGYNAWVDSLHTDIDKLPLKGNERKITRALFNATVWRTYIPTEMALNQLKSSGNFDLIKNSGAKREILIYDLKINSYMKYSEFVDGVEHSVDTSTMALIDIQISRKLLGALGSNFDKGFSQNGFLDINQIPEPVTFKSYSKAAFINYARRVDQVNVLLADMLSSYKGLLIEENKLLRVLKQEYHLGDE